VSHKLGAALRSAHYIGVITLILMAFFAGRLHGRDKFHVWHS
jgi:hypothetical protein